MTELATAPVHEPATDLRTRKPTKFLADLTRAMRLAADEARQSALAQFQADVERHMQSARGTCDAAAADARRRADEDITTLGEWETEEIARIRRETEESITARHGRLETELASQTSRLQAELARVDKRVRAFQSEMDAFFKGLQHEEDPAHFAAMAEALPEPPAFDAWTAVTEASDAPTALATRKNHAVTAPPAPVADASPAPDAPAASNDGMPPMKDGDFAAAEAEAAEWTAAEEPVAEAVTAPEPEPVLDIADAPEPEPTSPWPPAPAAPARPTSARTQVAVVGLVSVASIATFKRMLGRVQGVQSVQVSSGPDGEFLFTVTHDTSLDMATAVAGVSGFEVEVVESGPGVVNARAVDPEVV